MWRELSIYAYTFNEHIFIDDCRAQIYGDAIRVFLIFMMFIFRLLLIVCWGYDKDFKRLPEYHTRVMLHNTNPVILFLQMLEEVQMKVKCRKNIWKKPKKWQGELAAVIWDSVGGLCK